MVEQRQSNQVNIELTPDVAIGIFSNFTIISHSQHEFVFDFITFLPGMPKGKVVSRIIMTPAHAKKVMEILKTNIQKYESVFGTIKSDLDGNIPGPFIPPPGTTTEA